MNPETLARFFFLKKSLLLRLLFLTPFSLHIDTEKGPRFQSDIQRNASPFSPLQNGDVYTTYTRRLNDVHATARVIRSTEDITTHF